MRVLAVGAHPDDLELLAGGTLAKYAARGDTVCMAVSTDGVGGSTTLPEEEISAIRQAEARNAAALIGAEPIWLGLPEARLVDSAESRRRYIDLIRQTRPDVIITHDPAKDYHPDHLVTGQLLWNVRLMAVQQNLPTAHPPAVVIPELYFMDTVAGINFEPEHYVDISPTMETKRQMLSAHASQIPLMKERYGLTFLEFMEVCAAFRGVQAGVRFAECFRRSRTFPSHYAHRLP